MSIQKIVVIIPTYNESLVIEQTVHEVFAALSNRVAVQAHILIFDSCSTDNTQDIVRALQATYPHLHLQSEPEKTGLGSAYAQAMRYALTQLDADIVVEFDADLSHQPCYLFPMIEQMHHHDVVVGSRYIKGGSIPRNWGLHRKLLSILGNYVARFILTPKYKDFTSGFRVSHHSVLKKALPKQFISKNYAYKLELLWRLHQEKAKIIEYPIEFIDREKGESKLPANSILDSLRVLVVLRYRKLKSYLSMCMVGLVGLFVQCLVYNVLRVKFAPFFCAQLAVSAAMANNFVLNNQITFKKRNLNKQFKSVFVFVAYSLLMIGLQSYWARLGTYYFGLGYLKENLIIACGVVLGSLLNYLFYSKVVWREKNEPSFPPARG